FHLFLPRRTVRQRPVGAAHARRRHRPDARAPRTAGRPAGIAPGAPKVRKVRCRSASTRSASGAPRPPGDAPTELRIGAAPHQLKRQGPGRPPAWPVAGRAGPFPCSTRNLTSRAVLLDDPLGALRRLRTVVAFPARHDALLPTEGRESTARAARSEAG